MSNTNNTEVSVAVMFMLAALQMNHAKLDPQVAKFVDAFGSAVSWLDDRQEEGKSINDGHILAALATVVDLMGMNGKKFAREAYEEVQREVKSAEALESIPANLGA